MLELKLKKKTLQQLGPCGLLCLLLAEWSMAHIQVLAGPGMLQVQLITLGRHP